MKSVSLFILLSIAMFFCSCNQKSKVEKAIEEIPITVRVVRFEKDFFEAKPADLPQLKANYPFFFPAEYPDAVWIDKMQNPQWRELYEAVKNRFSDFSKPTEEIEDLFQHIQYYFPKTITPTVYTVIGEMDYNNKAIYANDKLIIALELYLGKDHKFYEFPVYLKQNFEPRQMLPDIVSAFSLRANPAPKEKTLLAEMIYYGKELYLKDVVLPDYTDAEKIGYTPEQIAWSRDNEPYIWRFMIDESLLYSTDSRLPNRFINWAPFSKFYLEIDNESPGRIGQWIGWQIVRSYMENNPKTTVEQLLKMDPNTIFEQSKYKPKKNE